MRGLRALVLLAAVGPCVEAREALPAIDACIATLDAAADVGYARIAARCPDLKPALTHSPWAAWLPADWTRADNQLSAAGLSELRTLLVHGADFGRVRRSAPRTEGVAAIVASITRPEEGGGGWWSHVKDWLRRILQPQSASADGGLRRWLAALDLSGGALQWIAWSALAAVVALAAGIVVNELRISGLLGRSALAARGLRRAPRRGPSTPLLDQIEHAAAHAQPALLLELIALRLAEQDRLPPARALTGRELGQRARLDDESCRERLVELVTVCERLRFSGRQVAAASLAAALRSGRLLLATLEAPPVLAPTALAQPPRSL